MAYYTRWSSGDELYHYGIPGQKWGQRRYQNPDGSLTAEGRARYGRIAERHYRAGRALNKFASAHKGSRVGNLAAKAGRRQVQIGNSYRNSKSQNARDKRLQTALKVGAGVAGAAALGYGAYRLAKGVRNGQISRNAIGNANRAGGVLYGRSSGAPSRAIAALPAKAESLNPLQRAGAYAKTASSQRAAKRFMAANSSEGQLRAEQKRLASLRRQAKVYNAKKAIKNAPGKAMNSIKSTARNIGSGARGFATKAGNAARNAGYGALGLATNAGNAGRNIARNIGNGARGFATKAGNAARNAGYAGLGLVSRKKRKK